MENWKKLAIRAAGFGAGFALLVSVVLGAVLWLSGRPAKPKPWNTKAIEATYARLILDNDSYFVFRYVLKNTTDKDYSISADTPIHLEARTDEGALHGCTDCLELERPVFIPPGDSAEIGLTLKYKYPLPTATDTREGREAARVAESNYLKNEMPRLGGFVLCDDNARYEVRLSPDWKK